MVRSVHKIGNIQIYPRLPLSENAKFHLNRLASFQRNVPFKLLCRHKIDTDAYQVSETQAISQINSNNG